MQECFQLIKIFLLSITLCPALWWTWQTAVKKVTLLVLLWSSKLNLLHNDSSRVHVPGPHPSSIILHVSIHFNKNCLKKEVFLHKPLPMPVHVKSYNQVCFSDYSSSPLSTEDMFQNPQWMTKTTNSTESYVHPVFFLYMDTYDKV